MYSYAVNKTKQNTNWQHLVVSSLSDILRNNKIDNLINIKTRGKLQPRLFLYFSIIMVQHV